MGTLILNWLIAHQDSVYGFVLGAALSNPGTCALLFFTAFTKIPGVGSWIARNPDKAKAWADEFDHRIDELVDKYAKDNTPVTTAPK